MMIKRLTPIKLSQMAENDLAMIFVVINNKSKVSSRSGMSLTRDTSRFINTG